MSMLAQPGTTASKKEPLPTGLLLATILVILQTVLRAYFLLSTLSAVALNPRFVPNPQFVFAAVIIPTVLLILTVVMIVLIFARLPAAKPYGIAVSALNILWSLYVLGRLFYLVGPGMSVFATAINLVYIAIFAAAIFFLVKSTIAAETEIAGTSHKGMAKASLVCAICGPLMLVILGPVALGLGIVARGKMRASNNFDGAGLALAGVIIGSIETAIGALMLLLYVAMKF